LKLGFDLESNGFLDQLTKIHCIAIMDFDTGQRWVYGPDAIDQAVQHLSQASELIAHNGICFDIPAIQKLYPDFSTDGIIVTDTLVLSRLIWGNLKQDDYEQGRAIEAFPRRLHGSHSLKAWGLRLNVLKGDFSNADTDWSEWSQEMQNYCEADVTVLHALWQHLQPGKWSQKAIRFEHSIAEICHRIGTAGWTFDTNKAAQLYAQLALERSTLGEELQSLFPAWTLEDEFIPKVNNKKLGYVKGEPFIKYREVQFNPNSRKHIEYCLRQKYGWKPTEFTPSGDAKIDETTLSGLHYPEAKALARSFMLQKRLGQVAEGNNAWMKLVSADGKLRHTINPLGTVTGRAASFGPNLQQVPATGAAFGKECRELFTVPPGFSLVGADLSSIELRCFAHFLPDGGEYGRELLNGDIHQINADRLGISRSHMKVVQYATLYGSGDARLGEILGKSTKEGKAIKEAYFKAVPAFPTLLRQIKQVVKQRGHLLGLDGRQLPVRSEHAALNVLLQSAGALIAKKWVQLIDQEIQRQQLDATIIAWVHDEVQIQVKGDADHVGNLTRRMAEEAGRHFGFKLPIAAEYQVGRSWADTH
jgi:DNA polymerase I-like protein with 3'-5' exonuclease and polymerase domains